MSDHPGDVLDEAAKLVDSLIRRFGGGGGGRARDAERDKGDRDPGTGGDVWGHATAENPAAHPTVHPTAHPTIATGAAECRDCPICRAIAFRRAAGGDAGRHLRDAGQSLLAAALDVAAAFDRSAPGRARPGGEGPGRAAREPPPDASRSPRAGRSERSDRPADTGEPWSAATGGDPNDIG